ncbi:DUF6327 family protein [Aequorivita viscosa]|uniref:Glutaminyl-tRNA synthetase n=1 Tax=Aequorivita viscosa TaxID=797419 RepID=A0A1M6BV66_9FLAO|nr:DUF6327 family protein [Aequorivita viscosa]SDW20396.1 hypothetical protein SAMN05216556_10358 [Aequorivita viscosa]SHI52398.1 hypothetical protein SAMN04487908_10358 [Aequorivita viscosa]
MKRYSTFEEIERDLKYLRLKKKIDREEVKLGVKQSREMIKETLSPVNIVANVVGSIVKKAFVLKVVDVLIGSTMKRK